MNIFNLICEYYDNNKHIRSYAKDFYSKDKVIEKYNALTQDKDIVSINIVMRNDNAIKSMSIDELKNTTF